MKKVYAAANLAEAYHVLNLLADEGIAAKVFNENAQGALGELPLNAYPEVWVECDNDLERARGIIKEYETPVGDIKSIKCRHCGEENPGNFQLCWRCSSALERK